MAQTAEQKAAAKEAKAKKAVIAELEAAGITDFDETLDSEALKALLPEEEDEAPATIVATPAMNKKQFIALIETYAKQNPEKYALKKAELDKKLKAFG